MAGSDHSGEDVQAGRTNRAEDRTRIWAQEDEGQEFNADIILVVEEAGDFEDDFHRPSKRLHAILGAGLNEGAGVIGLDNGLANEDISHVVNVGVFGRGKTGVEGDSTRGGTGVQGVGGDKPFARRIGAGVVGRGGRQPDEDNKERLSHGPGVVGIGGGRSQELKNDEISQNVGVFGQGAEAETRTVQGTIHGPRSPGAGVVGRGGVSKPEGQFAPGVIGCSASAPFKSGITFSFEGIEGDIGVLGKGATGVKGIGNAGPGVRGTGSSLIGDGPVAHLVGPGVVGEGGTGSDPAGPSNTTFHGAGVIGIAGETPLPAFADTIETGVYGAGRDGVKGAGSEGRGGIFQSERSAQVRLIPARRSTEDTEQTSFIPTVIADPGLSGLKLPADGRSGDLMSLVDDKGQCSLWFCVRDNAGAARWAQVLLGPAFDGKA